MTDCDREAPRTRGTCLLARWRRMNRRRSRRHAGNAEGFEVDPNAALLRGAPTLKLGDPSSAEPRLPARVSVGGRRKVCAAYSVECIPGSLPPRGRVALAHGGGGLGLGVPLDERLANGSSAWRLRARDFCTRPPPEIRWLPPDADIPRGRRRGVPGPSDCFCSTESLMPRHSDPRGFGRRVPAGALPGVPHVPPSARVCRAGNGFVTFQCSERLLLPPPSASGDAAAVDVLMATYDHHGHGLFAIVQRVVNQVLLARQRGLEPYVFIGERSFAEPQACEYGASPYYAPSLGANIWEYWFKQPGDFRLGMRRVRGRRVASLQVFAVAQADRSGAVRAYGSTFEYKQEERRSIRLAAHEVVGPGGARLVKDAIRRRAATVFAAWRERSAHIMGMHARGTDKVVQPKVPPEAYFPLVDAYLTAHADALLFVATDDAAYLERVRRRYASTGRLVTAPRGAAARRRGGAAIAGQSDERWWAARTRDVEEVGASDEAYAMGAGALVDALLLSQCDFVLKATSAVAEFALWANPALSEHHLDLQLTDRFRTQRLPAWTRHMLRAEDDAPAIEVGGARRPAPAADGLRRVVARVFCTALAAGCANESAHLYRGPRYCSQCQPET